MKLLKRIAFVLKHDIEPDYIITPYGGELNECRFVNYADAVKYQTEYQKKQPMYGKPKITIVVKD